MGPVKDKLVQTVPSSIKQFRNQMSKSRLLKLILLIFRSQNYTELSICQQGLDWQECEGGIKELKLETLIQSHFHSHNAQFSLTQLIRTHETTINQQETVQERKGKTD
jgi:hypothetical protein